MVTNRNLMYVYADWYFARPSEASISPHPTATKKVSHPSASVNTTSSTNTSQGKKTSSGSTGFKGGQENGDNNQQKHSSSSSSGSHKQTSQQTTQPKKYDYSRDFAPWAQKYGIF